MTGLEGLFGLFNDMIGVGGLLGTQCWYDRAACYHNGRYIHLGLCTWWDPMCS